MALKLEFRLKNKFFSILFLWLTQKVAGDSPELMNHIEILKTINADLELYSADGVYGSVLNHSDIWYHLNAKPVISFASNAVINEEGKEERIDNWATKYRK